MNITYKIVILLLCLSACSSIKQRQLKTRVTTLEDTFQDHVGFVLYNLEKEKAIVEHNADRYFTPASNTKVITYLGALEILGDSIPALYYKEYKDSIVFWGSGDPSFLYVQTGKKEAFDFLSNSNKALSFSSANFYDPSFGPGWSWDDYYYRFQPEKSSFPIGGNLVAFSDTLSLTIQPATFTAYLNKGTPKQGYSSWVRDNHSNRFTYHKGKKNSKAVPFMYSDSLFVRVLQDTLQRKVQESKQSIPSDKKAVYSSAADSVYKKMMVESDNFIAEQLLLVMAGKLTDSLQSQHAIDYMQKEVLQDLPHPIQWVDGSGLSRYNLVTPSSMVAVWNKILQHKSIVDLQKIIAAGGRNGTLKNWYLNKEPYIYGKTGTLSNNHNLSGIIKTDRGNLYLFALMNNNYLGSSKNVKIEMEQVLLYIKEKF